MNEETFKTLASCSIFVFLFGTSGFLVASIVNATKVYVKSRGVAMYSIWVKTQMFSGTFLTYYLFAGILFAGVALFIVYLWSPTDSTKRGIVTQIEK
jgi:hypothetical protein